MSLEGGGGRGGFSLPEIWDFKKDDRRINITTVCPREVVPRGGHPNVV